MQYFKRQYWVFIEGTRVMLTQGLTYKSTVRHHCICLCDVSRKESRDWIRTEVCCKLVWWSKWHRWQCSLHLDQNGGVHYLLEGPSWGVLMLALRSRLTGPGSRVGRPVAEVVVVHVEEIRLKSPGGKLRLKRCYSKRTYIKFRLKQCWQWSKTLRVTNSLWRSVLKLVKSHITNYNQFTLTQTE